MIDSISIVFHWVVFLFDSFLLLLNVWMFKLEHCFEMPFKGEGWSIECGILCIQFLTVVDFILLVPIGTNEVRAIIASVIFPPQREWLWTDSF